jgi:hypothetical protein
MPAKAKKPDKRGQKRKHSASEDEGDGKDAEKERKEVERWVHDMPIMLTGIPVAGPIQGFSPTTKDTVIRYVGPEIKPRKWMLDRVHKFGDVWSTLLKNLARIPFFAEMTLEEREAWLYDGAYDLEQDLVDLAETFGGVAKGYVLQAGDPKKSKLAGLDDEVIGEWMADPEPVPLSTVRRAIMGQTGKRSLFFLPNYWTLRYSAAGKVPKDFHGFAIVLGQDVIQASYRSNPSDKEYLIDKKLAIKDPTPAAQSKTPLGSDADMLRAMLAAWADQTQVPNPVSASASASALTAAPAELTQLEKERTLLEVRGVLREWLLGLPSAWHKSLMQKLIRFQPLSVESPLGDRRLPSEAVLSHPGGLTPNVRRYVTGVEAFFKRLAVILPEDAFVDDSKDLVFLLSCAAVAKQVASWKPPPALVVRAFRLGLRGLRTRLAMTYDTRNDHAAFSLSPSLPPWRLASWLLDSVGSMAGDKRMYRDLALSEAKQAAMSQGRPRTEQRPAVMNLLHCVDQHCATAVAYFFPHAVVLNASASRLSKEEKGRAKQSAPFSDLFSRLFGEVTGVNPRRSTDISLSAFGREAVLAQRRYWAATHRHVEPFKSAVAAFPARRSSRSVVVRRELPDAWLAGGVGVLHVRGDSTRPPAMVTLRTSDIEDLVVIRNPSRDIKTKERLTEEQQEEAAELARDMLRKGVPWTGCKPPVPEWDGAKIQLVDGKQDEPSHYTVQPKNSKRPLLWSDLRKLELSIPTFSPPPASASASVSFSAVESSSEWFLLPSRDGVQADADELLSRALAGASEGVLRQALTYVGNYQSSFSFPRISRSGGAVKGGVNVDDVGAFQLLLAITRWFPSALQFVAPEAFSASPLDFAVRTGPLLWELSDRVRRRVAQLAALTLPVSLSSSSSSSWPLLKDRMLIGGRPRVPWKHQEESVQYFWARRRQGYRGNMLSAPPGLGKSRIVTQYAAEQISNRVLPEYIVYTCPGEAMKTVIDEWLAYGATVHILDPHVNSKIRQNPHLVRYVLPMHSPIRPFTVSIVEHDHLRDLAAVLTPSVMSRALFVLDEAHRALNESKRTQICLELCIGAREFICMTGTYVIDSKFDKLVPWLAQIAPIPVDRNNFWVALNSMIAHRVDTGIPVRREHVSAPLTAAELADFKALMPPGLGGNNSVSDHSSINRGIAVTEKACMRMVVSKALEFLRNRSEPGVMIVAKNANHAADIRSQLEQSGEVKSFEIIVLGEKPEYTSINMTSSNLRESYGHVRVVVVPVKYSTGYNLSRFRIMISTVIASNAATRDQLEGRINRIGQQAKEVLYVVVLDSTGFWAGVLANHEYPRRVNDVLKYALAKPVNLTAAASASTTGGAAITTVPSRTGGAAITTVRSRQMRPASSPATQMRFGYMSSRPAVVPHSMQMRSGYTAPRVAMGVPRRFNFLRAVSPSYQRPPPHALSLSPLLWSPISRPSALAVNSMNKLWPRRTRANSYL